MSDLDMQAWDMGFEAGSIGIGDNPFPIGSEAASAWAAGYFAGQEIYRPPSRLWLGVRYALAWTTIAAVAAVVIYLLT